MAVLGQPYRIMYLSKGMTGLTNIKAVVLKPDDSVAGIFPLRELSGMFQGCYVYDYVSSTSDREGEHFSRVISPTEGVTDIVRFELYKASAGEGLGQSLSPNPLVAYIKSGTLFSEVLEARKAEVTLGRSEMSASFGTEHVLTANVLDQVAEAVMSANETIAVPRYC